MKMRVSRSAALLRAALIGLLLTLLSAGAVRADTVDVTTNDFGISYYSTSYVNVAFALPYTDLYAEAQLLDVNMNVIASSDSYSYRGTITVSYPTRKNKVYYYRIIPFDKTEDGQKVYVGAPSPLKAFTTLALKGSMPSKKKRQLKIKCPKIKGVKTVKVMMSKKRDGGFKKVATLKPGKSKILSKFGKKAFVNYTTYYYKPAVTLTSKVKCESVYQNSIWFYTTFR